MTTLARKPNQPSYRQTLQMVRNLPPAEQRRLRDELDRLIGVDLVRPKSTPAAIRRGRRIAKTVRAELSKSVAGTLDETMRRLRGRSWS